MKNSNLLHFLKKTKMSLETYKNNLITDINNTNIDENTKKELIEKIQKVNNTNDIIEIIKLMKEIYDTLGIRNNLEKIRNNYFQNYFGNILKTIK